MPDPTLSEDKRRQLDGIVSQMEANQEKPETIQAVVDDFKQKYTTTPETPKPELFKPSTWQSLTPQGLVQAAKEASPSQLLTKENLPMTAASIAGAATGGLAAIPVAGATAMLTSAAQGGTPEENLAQGAFGSGAEVFGPLSKAMRPAGARLMQSAVKPAGDAAWSVLKDIKAGAAVPEVVKTLLDNGISVSKTGVARLNALIGKGEEAVTQAVRSLPGTVQPKAVAAYVAPAARRAAKAGTDVSPIGTVVQDFLNNPLYQQALTAPELQDLKQAGYQVLRNEYGQLGSAVVEGRKALYHGAKTEIEELGKAAGRTDIRDLNANLGKLTEAFDAVAQRVASQGNKDIAGLAILAHFKAAALASIIDRSPAVKSMLARGLWNSASAASGVAPTALRSLVMGVASTPDETPNGP